MARRGLGKRIKCDCCCRQVKNRHGRIFYCIFPASVRVKMCLKCAKRFAEVIKVHMDLNMDEAIKHLAELEAWYQRKKRKGEIDG